MFQYRFPVLRLHKLPVMREDCSPSPAITGAIVGARNAKQAEGIVGAAELRLAPGEVDELLAV
jgi:hypothetical protein